MKVSVVTITYNHEKYIAQAIESILMQKTNFDYEYMIGEDCSTDGTREIVINYKNKYPDKIRLFLPEKNIGGILNFVQTLKPSQGEYIALLDGDDYWTSPHKLQKQADFLDSHPECAICCHDAELIYEDRSRKPWVSSSPNQKKIYTLDDLLTGGNPLITCTIMYRKGLFGEFPDWFYKIPFGDWALHILNAQHGDIGFITESMAVHIIHDGGVYSSLDQIEVLKGKIIGREIVKNNLDLSNPHKKKLNATLYNYYYQLYKIYIENGDLANARTYLKKCIRHLRDGRGETSFRRFVKMILRVYSPRLYKLGRTARTPFAHRSDSD